MPQWYNLTSIDATNLLTLTQSVNREFMQNDMGILFLIILFFISFISFSLYSDDPKVNLTASFSIVAVLSIPLRILDLLPDFIPFLCWGLFALSLVILLIKK